jgi:hypothetical protein
MAANKIAGIRLRRRVRTTIPEPADQRVPDLLERDFTAQAPNNVYVGDITYLPCGGGQNLYLATVIWTSATVARACLVGVGECLGGDVVGGELDRFGQPPFYAEFDANGDGEAAGERLQRWPQAAPAPRSAGITR